MEEKKSVITVNGTAYEVSVDANNEDVKEKETKAMNNSTFCPIDHKFIRTKGHEGQKAGANKSKNRKKMIKASRKANRK